MCELARMTAFGSAWLPGWCPFASLLRSGADCSRGVWCCLWWLRFARFGRFSALVPAWFGRFCSLQFLALAALACGLLSAGLSGLVPLWAFSWACVEVGSLALLWWCGARFGRFSALFRPCQRCCSL